MKNLRRISVLLWLFLFTINTNAQIIESNTLNVKISNAKIKRGLPPDLYAELSFEDENGNGVLESTETAVLTVKIINRGKGRAQGLKININDDNYDRDLIIKDNIKIAVIEPGRTYEVKIKMKAGLGIKTKKHRLRINVTEHFRYDMDPAYLILQTLEYQKPIISFAGIQVFDTGEGTATTIADGQIQAGEMVKIKVLIQNIGKNVSKNVKTRISTLNSNVFIAEIEGRNYSFKEIKIGEVKELWYKLSPNKLVKAGDNLQVYISIRDRYGYGNLSKKLPLVLGERPPKIEVLEVHANINHVKQNQAQFTYSSKKFVSTKAKLINIKMVEPAYTERSNSVAVVIGIDNYKYLPPAPYAENDAKLMKEYYKKRLGVNNVVLFTGDEVSGFVFDDIFNPQSGELNKAIVPGKTDLFVYYSGHGIPSKDGKRVFLLPKDGKISRLEQQGYDLSELYANLDKFNAKSVTVFLDACFTGASRTSEKFLTRNLTGEKGIIIKPKMAKPWEKNPKFTVFTSSSGSQTSLAYDDAQSGLFTYYLMAGMQGKADANNDRKITMGELKDYVINNVSLTSKRISGKQTPEFHGDKNKILVEY